MAESKNEFGNAVAKEAIIGVSVSVTAMFLAWMLRSGTLLASLFSISPLWRQLDPLVIVNASSKKQSDSNEKSNQSVEKMFDS